MNKVLLIRTDFFGDCVLSSIFLEMFAQNVPKVIDVLATTYNINAFKYHPAVRNLFCINHNPSTKELADNLSELEKINCVYDIVVILNRDFRNYRYLTKIKAKKIFGHRLGRKSFKSNLFCFVAGKLPKYNFLEYDQSEHEVMNQVKLLKYLAAKTGIKVGTEIPKSSLFYYEPALKVKSEKLFNSLLINISGRAGSFKYLNDAMVFTLLSILKKDYAHIALVAMPDERSRLEAILADFQDLKVEIICDSDIFKVAKLMERYEIFIGCDGGLMHVAASIGLRVIGVFHNQVATSWHAWTPTQAYVQSKTKNIYDVTPFDIINTLHFC